MLAHLQLKAELWIINSDFALDFARPLLPNTVYIGGLINTSNKTLALHLDVRKHPQDGAFSAEMAIIQTQGQRKFIF